MTRALERVLEAKEVRRRRLAADSFPAKVRTVVRLQELVAPILRKRGRLVFPWRIGPRT